MAEGPEQLSPERQRVWILIWIHIQEDGEGQRRVLWATRHSCENSHAVLPLAESAPNLQSLLHYQSTSKVAYSRGWQGGAL